MPVEHVSVEHVPAELVTVGPVGRDLMQGSTTRGHFPGVSDSRRSYLLAES